MKLKNNQVLAYLGLFFLVFGNLLFFQNCSPNKSNIENLSSTTGLVATSSVRIDGQCSRTINNCNSGSFLNVADSATQSLWKCNGSGGGVNVLCSSAFSTTPVDGQCSPTAINGCIQGSMNDLADNFTTNIWRCEGFNGGVGVDCSLPRTSNQVAANGQCGGAKDACNVGSFVDVTDTETQNRWICRGILGAADANCATTIIPIYTGGGSCGATVNTCNSSATMTDLPDSSTNYFWRCTNSNGYYDSCYKARSSCSLEVAPLTLVNDNYTYNIKISNGNLPATVILKQFGSHANPNGSNKVTDGDGSAAYTSTVSTPISITKTNLGGAQAGLYERSYEVINPTTNETICTTTAVQHMLTPACGLSVSATSSYTTGSVTFTAEMPKQDELELASPAYNVVWYGSKTVDGLTTNDETGRSKMGAQGFPYTTATPNVGTFKRYYTVLDRSDRVLCRSNEVTYTVTTPPVVVVAPTPTPTPVPAPEPTPGPKDCSFNGQTLAHGKTVTAYTSNRVNYGSSCESVQLVRTCNDGQLDNNNATFAACSPDTVVKPHSCRIVQGGNDGHCGSNEVLQSISIYAATYLIGSTQMMCCQMNVDLEETENPVFSRWGVKDDDREHYATCNEKQMISGYSVVPDKYGQWDGNLTLYCRSMTSKTVGTNPVSVGNGGSSGITNYGADNRYHSTTCGDQFLGALGLYATEHLDNISRETCTGFPIVPAETPSPSPGTGGGGVGDGGGCGGGVANISVLADGPVRCN